MYSLTLAIPAYNEEATLPDVLTEALAVAPTLARDWEILLVDDGSTDKTGEIMDAAGLTYGTIKVIHHPKNLGFSGAIASCYRHASKELIFLAPADGQVRLKDCTRFLSKIGAADLVIGYRKTHPESLVRNINSFLFHSLYRLLFGIKCKEISTAILWKKSLLDQLELTANPRSAMINAEALVRAKQLGAKFAAVGIPYYPRRAGHAHGTDLRMILVTTGELLRLWWNIQFTYGTR